MFYGYSTAAPPPVAAPDLITMVRGSEAAFGYLVSPAGRTFWFARVAGAPVGAEERARTTPAQWRAWLEPLLRPDRTPCADIVAGTGEELMVTNALHLPAGNRWRSRRVVLIGDAAHAASPATGQGASMALEDAVVLAKALRDAPSAEAALAAYEYHRRPRTDLNTATSARLTASRPPAGSGPQDGPPPQDSARPATRPDEALLRLLDWDNPAPAPGARRLTAGSEGGRPGRHGRRSASGQRPSRRANRPLRVDGSQSQRALFGMPARTCSTCRPQPAWVALPQVRQVVRRHTGDSSGVGVSRPVYPHGYLSCGDGGPGEG
ncbi:hypothetical protein GCM10020229_82560 [Kitasatospora albolonga]